MLLAHTPRPGGVEWPAYSFHKNDFPPVACPLVAGITRQQSHKSPLWLSGVCHKACRSVHMEECQCGWSCRTERIITDYFTGVNNRFILLNNLSDIKAESQGLEFFTHHVWALGRLSVLASIWWMVNRRGPAAPEPPNKRKKKKKQEKKNREQYY